MKQWEYKITYYESNMEALGKMGWELVTIVCHLRGTNYYYKRELK